MSPHTGTLETIDLPAPGRLGQAAVGHHAGQGVGDLVVQPPPLEEPGAVVAFLEHHRGQSTNSTRSACSMISLGVGGVRSIAATTSRFGSSVPASASRWVSRS